MNINIQNQSPTDFTTLMPKISHFDTTLTDEINNLVSDPFTNAYFTPLQANTPVHIQLDQTIYDTDKIKELITKSLTSNDINTANDDQLSIITHQASKYRASTPQNWKQIVANTFLLKNNAELPTPTIVYTYENDIQNQAKAVIQNDNQQTRTQLEIGLIGNLLNNPLSRRWLFILTNSNDYQQIQQNLNLISNNNAALGNQLQQNVKDIQQLALDKNDCFTSWVTGNNNDPNSFNRIVNYILNQLPNTKYTKILPLNLHAMLNPIGFSFINIESLINSDNLSYRHELKELEKITNRLVAFKVTKLSKIQSAKTISQSINQKSHKKEYTKKRKSIRTKRKSQGFSKTLPSANTQLKRLVKIVNHHISTMMSDNTYKNVRTTFMRPNRRHPNDPNLRGTIQTTKFRPDIHIFLDTSGSISEDQYKTGVTFLIKIAKKLNTNLFFTSFSHEITTPVKLKTKNASVKQIYHQIQLIPKASGGTEYENVWNMIDYLEVQNQKRHQAPQLNFMITDFAYDIRSSWSPRTNRASTKMLYYLPLASDQYDYDNCKQFGTDFANELIDAGDINIKSRILM